MGDQPTPADVWVQRRLRPKRDENLAVLRETVEGLRAEGMTWFRVTELDEYGVFVVEGWKARPVKPAPFEPALMPQPDIADPRPASATGPVDGISGDDGQTTSEERGSR